MAIGNWLIQLFSFIFLFHKITIYNEGIILMFAFIIIQKTFYWFALLNINHNLLLYCCATYSLCTFNYYIVRFILILSLLSSIQLKSSTLNRQEICANAFSLDPLKSFHMLNSIKSIQLGDVHDTYNHFWSLDC